MDTLEYIRGTVVTLLHGDEDKRLLVLRGTPNSNIGSSVSSSRSLFTS